MITTINTLGDLFATLNKLVATEHADDILSVPVRCSIPSYCDVNFGHPITAISFDGETVELFISHRQD